MNGHFRRERCALVAAVFVIAIGAMTPLARAGAENCARWQQTATTQVVMNVCSAQDASHSGREVARMYLAYRETLTGGRRKAVDATQRAWAKYRETYCAEKGAAVSGGSIQPLVINVCMDTLNRRRALDLTNDRSDR